MPQADYESLYRELLPLFESNWLRSCAFGEAFRNDWKQVLRRNARNPKEFRPDDPAAELAVPHRFEGTGFTFHFNQLKLAEWFRQDSKEGQRRVFLAHRMIRDGENALHFFGSPCQYDPSAQEPAVPEQGSEILACSLPGFPPPLQIVYGNRRVESSFTGFRRRKLPFFLIQAEFTPAFLCDSFEMCVYLFWMDCCIMASNRVKVNDKDLKPLLHIFRPSSILTINGLT